MPFRGEVFFEDVDYIDLNIGQAPAPVNEKAGRFRRCFTFPAFADLTDSDPLKNDIKGFNLFLPVVLTPTMKLQKFDIIWNDVAILNDDSFGTLFDSFPAKRNRKLFGYRIEWLKVLTTEGAGLYRVLFDFGSGAVASDEYCLQHYDPCLVHETVRFGTVKNREVPSANQIVSDDYGGTNWIDQIRIPNSYMSYDESPTTNETYLLNSDEEIPFDSSYRDIYQLTVKRLLPEMFHALKFQLLTADRLTVTDYSLDALKRLGTFNETVVRVDGNFKPVFKGKSDYGTMVMQFINPFFNTRNKYSP